MNEIENVIEIWKKTPSTDKKRIATLPYKSSVAAIYTYFAKRTDDDFQGNLNELKKTVEMAGYTLLGGTTGGLGNEQSRWYLLNSKGETFEVRNNG